MNRRLKYELTEHGWYVADPAGRTRHLPSGPFASRRDAQVVGEARLSGIGGPVDTILRHASGDDGAYSLHHQLAEPKYRRNPTPFYGDRRNEHATVIHFVYGAVRNKNEYKSGWVPMYWDNGRRRTGDWSGTGWDRDHALDVAKEMAEEDASRFGGDYVIYLARLPAWEELTRDQQIVLRDEKKSVRSYTSAYDSLFDLGLIGEDGQTTAPGIEVLDDAISRGFIKSRRG